MDSMSSSHWILIPGLAREARHWSRFAKKLEAALLTQGESARVDALDLPGVGRFSDMKSPLTIPDITEFTREKYIEIRRKLRDRGETPSERTRLFGISMGGMVAIDWASRWPDDFKEVIFVNTSLGRYSNALNRLTPYAIKNLLSLTALRDQEEREFLSFKLLSNLKDEAYHRELAKTYAGYAAERPLSIENFSRQLLACARYLGPETKPDVEMLALYSEKDRMVSSKCSKEIIRHWKLSCYRHPTGGHDLTTDDCDWLVAKTLEWERSL